MSVEHLLKTKKEYKNLKKQDIQSIYIKTYWTKSALNMKWFMEILKIYLETFTENLRQTSFRVKQRTTGKVQFLFVRSFLLVLTQFLFWEEDWALGYTFMKF